MKAVLAVLTIFFCGCGASQKSNAIDPGPNYSNTPCADNCGTDTACNAECKDISAHDPAPLDLSH